MIVEIKAEGSSVIHINVVDDLNGDSAGDSVISMPSIITNTFEDLDCKDK